MTNPATRAGEQARELHKIAFPESYTIEVELNEDGTPKVAPADPNETPAVGPQPEHVEQDAQAKYDALLSKYNSEVPRLHSWVRQKDEKIAQLEGQIAELREKPAPASTGAPEMKDRDEEGNVLYRSPHVTDEMRSTDNYQFLFGEYGQTYAERHLETSILAARSTVKPVEDRVDSASASTAEELFNKDLSSICPAWQGLKAGVNVDPEFIAWLQGKVPGARQTLHADLVEAYQTADAGRMAEIINLYQKPKPTAAARTIPAELITPNKTGGGQQTVLDNTKGNVMRMSDMTQLYADHRDGKYVGKEVEYQKKKDEFMQAKAEGRLV